MRCRQHRLAYRQRLNAKSKSYPSDDPHNQHIDNEALSYLKPFKSSSANSLLTILLKPVQATLSLVMPWWWYLITLMLTSQDKAIDVGMALREASHRWVSYISKHAAAR
ncbi:MULTISPECIES: hypothetical protein [Alteromonas]|uniref:hypothetical protein n=1 Tax=Alteromonas TaxID=226 RepID=UPI00135BE266|nr:MULTISPECIES: hypothetical protein [Alteromonas]